MLDYKRILGLRYGSNLSGREIAKSCRYSKSAVNEFLKRFKENGQLKLPLAPDVTNENIEELYRQPAYEEIHKALAKKGETLQRPWRKYNALGEGVEH